MGFCLLLVLVLLVGIGVVGDLRFGLGFGWSLMF